MERVLSDEEKFRKAEEIYNRRRNINVTVPARELNRNKEKKDKKHYRKMLIQIGISICIYFSVYFIQYSNYYFSNDVIKRVETILSYDINFSETFKTVGEYIKNNKFFSGVFFFLNNDELNKNSMLEDHSGALNIIENNIENNINEQNINGNNVLNANGEYTNENSPNELNFNGNTLNQNGANSNGQYSNGLNSNGVIENSVIENAVINNNQIAGLGNENGSQQLDAENIENIGGVETEENLGIGGRRRDCYSE